MDFPADFNLIEEQGVDSYVGRVQGDEISLFFNYGSYANDLGPTPEEYLQDSAWLMEAAYPFLQPGVEYDDRNWPKIQVLSIRKATGQDSSLGAGCDYVARCQYQGKFFEHPVYLPEETKNTIFQLDTVEYQYRRIAVAKAPYTITTGMYIRDISEKDLALCIATDSLTKAQQELVLKIFSTVRKAR